MVIIDILYLTSEFEWTSVGTPIVILDGVLKPLLDEAAEE